MQFYFLMLRFCRLLLALPAKKNLHSLSSIINHIRLINILAVTLFKQPSLHPKSTGKYFRIQDDHPTALPLNANLTELCKPAQWRAALWEGECRNEMREGPLRWNKNRLPWSYHDMAQTFSLWGKKMFLTAVIVFTTFSSSFFVGFLFLFFSLCNSASWRMLHIKDETLGNPALLLCEIILAMALCANCIKHTVYLFICLGKSQREQAIEVMCGMKTRDEMGREGLEPLLWENLSIRDEMIPTSKCCRCSGAQAVIPGSQGI